MNEKYIFSGHIFLFHIMQHVCKKKNIYILMNKEHNCISSYIRCCHLYFANVHRGLRPLLHIPTIYVLYVYSRKDCVAASNIQIVLPLLFALFSYATVYYWVCIWKYVCIYATKSLFKNAQDITSLQSLYVACEKYFTLVLSFMLW